MTDPDLLHRRYRRLLRAYPRWYRREREREMLTTLLDAAPPDRQYPTGREILDLIRQGIWCRLKLPRHPGYAIVTVIVASFTMLAGAALAGALARATIAAGHAQEQPAITGATAAAVATGALVGVLTGWLVMSWVLQRYRRQPNLVKVAIALFNLPVLAIMLGWWLFLSGCATTGCAWTGSDTPSVLIPADALISLSQLWLPQLTAIALVAGLIAAAPLRDSPIPRQVEDPET